MFYDADADDDIWYHDIFPPVASDFHLWPDLRTWTRYVHLGPLRQVKFTGRCWRSQEYNMLIFFRLKVKVKTSYDSVPAGWSTWKKSRSAMETAKWVTTVAKSAASNESSSDGMIFRRNLKPHFTYPSLGDRSQRLCVKRWLQCGVLRAL